MSLSIDRWNDVDWVRAEKEFPDQYPRWRAAYEAEVKELKLESSSVRRAGMRKYTVTIDDEGAMYVDNYGADPVDPVARKVMIPDYMTIGVMLIQVSQAMANGRVKRKVAA